MVQFKLVRGGVELKLVASDPFREKVQSGSEAMALGPEGVYRVPTVLAIAKRKRVRALLTIANSDGAKPGQSRGHA